jgi:hypothetical protein
MLLRTLITPLLTFWLFMKQPPLQRRALIQLAINSGSMVAATTSWVLVLIALFVRGDRDWFASNPERAR